MAGFAFFFPALTFVQMDCSCTVSITYHAGLKMICLGSQHHIEAKTKKGNFLPSGLSTNEGIS